VKIETEDIELEKPPQFGLVGDFGQGGPKDKPFAGEFYPDPYPGITMETEAFPIEIENFGPVPARQSVVTASIFAQSNVSGTFGSIASGPSRWREFGCDKAKWDFATSPYYRPIFPGKEERHLSARVVLPITAHQIYEYSIVVCLAYEGSGGELHHTAVLYCGGGVLEFNPSTVAVDAPKVRYSPRLSYSPQRRFHACQGEAD
jgi:hypothetical protein